MTDTVQPYSDPEATPVGHLGTRVDIHERQAWAISGWLGVLAIAVVLFFVALAVFGRLEGNFAEEL